MDVMEIQLGVVMVRAICRRDTHVATQWRFNNVVSWWQIFKNSFYDEARRRLGEFGR